VDGWTFIPLYLVFIAVLYPVASRLGPVRSHKRRLLIYLVWTVGGSVGGAVVLLTSDYLLGGGVIDIRAHMDVLAGFVSGGAFVGAVAGLFRSTVR
jgi:hypothetical protein